MKQTYRFYPSLFLMYFEFIYNEYALLSLRAAYVVKDSKTQKSFIFRAYLYDILFYHHNKNGLSFLDSLFLLLRGGY